MPIEIICQSCSQRLRIPDEHAGKKARCPKCGHIQEVRAAADAPSVPVSPPPGVAASPQPGVAAASMWHVATADGATHGPLRKDELDRWAGDGRLNDRCQVIEQGGQQWRPAAELFPQLRAGGGYGQAAATGGYSPSGPAGYTPAGGYGPAAPGNPYSDKAVQGGFPPPGGYAPPGGYGSPYGPAAGGYAKPYGGLNTGGFQRPHRGGLILALGLIGLIGFFVLYIPAVVGIAAWVMGQDDLRQMRMGRMDSSGRGMTMTGMILGIVATAFLVLGGCCCVLGMLAGNG